MEPATDTHRPNWTFRSGYACPDRDRRMSCVTKVACHMATRGSPYNLNIEGLFDDTL